MRSCYRRCLKSLEKLYSNCKRPLEYLRILRMSTHESSHSLIYAWTHVRKQLSKTPYRHHRGRGRGAGAAIFYSKITIWNSPVSVVGHRSPLLHLKLSLRDLLLRTTSSVTFSPLIVINKISEVSSHVLWRSRLVLSYYNNGLECRFVSCWPLGVHFWGHSGSVGFNVRIAACVPRCGTEWSEKSGMRVTRPASERSLPAAACAACAPRRAVGCDGASQLLRLPWPLPQAFWLIYIDKVFDVRARACQR